MRVSLIQVGLAAMVISGPALAQDSVHRTAQVAAGQTVRLGVFGNVKADCSPGPLPEIKLITSPRAGAVIVRRGRAKTNESARCANIEVPMQAIYYQANANFAGEEELSFEVKSASGKVVIHNLKVNVRPRSAVRPSGKQLDL